MDHIKQMADNLIKKHGVEQSILDVKGIIENTPENDGAKKMYKSILQELESLKKSQ